MDPEEFKRCGRLMIDYVADYCSNIRDRPVVPTVEPGYMRKLLPDQAPDKPEDFDEIMKDIERIIMPGITHWHHPQFHAYFSTAQSWPSIVADILCGGIACIGFTWIASPACTELEVCMMDWLAKLLQLPEAFLSSSRGGGVIQGTASEATLVCLLAARNKSIAEAKAAESGKSNNAIQSNGSSAVAVAANTADAIDDTCRILSKLVVYYSDQAHSSVERATLITLMRNRKLKTDQNHQLRGDVFEKAIKEDLQNGLIPCFLVATLGTTPSCAFDNLVELGQVAQKYNVWMHIDAAYAGSAFICPEYRNLLNGVEYAMSFNFNPHKWMSVNFDCSALWLREAAYVTDAFNVNPLYLQSEYQGNPDAPEYRHWQIPLGRRFRALKLWFVMRCFGSARLQQHIRLQISLAKEFEALVRADDRFEIVADVIMGLVCFRIKDDNASTEALYEKIRKDNRIHLVSSHFDDPQTYFLRFAVCGLQTGSEDVKFAYKVISELTGQLSRH